MINNEKGENPIDPSVVTTVVAAMNRVAEAKQFAGNPEKLVTERMKDLLDRINQPGGLDALRRVSQISR